MVVLFFLLLSLLSCMKPFLCVAWHSHLLLWLFNCVLHHSWG